MANQKNDTANQAAHVANTFRGAAGGVYRAASAAVAKKAGKLAAAIFGAFFLLVVVFILMLPPGIIGDEFSSDGLGNTDELHRNISDLTATIHYALADAVADVERRISEDIAATNPEHYEINNPYAFYPGGDEVMLLSQYCCANSQTYRHVSTADLERLLRQDISGFYTYTRSTETRVFEDDDPETPDVVELRSEQWVIYTVTYTGETHFADTILHLTVAQKAYSLEYKRNLEIFLEWY